MSRWSVLVLVALALLSACSKHDASLSRAPSEPAAAPPAQEPASGPNASMGSVGDVDRVIATLRPKFKACYQTALNADPAAEGSVSLVTRISPDGHVIDVSAPDRTTMSPALVECLAGVVRGATFPAPGGTGSVLRVPVTFNNQSSPTR